MVEVEKSKELPIVETKPLTYLCKFDENGRRGETRLSVDYTDEQKADMLKNGFVEITQEEWELYCEDGGNKYIRGTDGKPTLAPPHVPTKAEKLAQLESQYNNDKAELKGYMVDAIIADDTDTMTELKQDMADVEADYQAKREGLEG